MAAPEGEFVDLATAINQPEPSASPSPLLLGRRELLKLGGLGFVLFLVSRGDISTLDSPLAKVFLYPPYRSPTLPRFLVLSREEAQNLESKVVGESYLAGQGGSPPTELADRLVTDANIGQWTSDIQAVSGSYLTDIPRQLAKLSPARRDAFIVAVSDTGWNTVTDGFLREPGALETFNKLLELLKHVNMWNLPQVVSRLNDVCEIFLRALDSTQPQLQNSLLLIADTTDVSHLIALEFPPLQYATALVHVPQKGDPSDTSFSFEIYGDRYRSLFAQQFSLHGSGMAERALDTVALERPNVSFTPMPIQLTRADYYGSGDEHPTRAGYNTLAVDLLKTFRLNQETIASLERNRRRG